MTARPMHRSAGTTPELEVATAQVATEAEASVSPPQDTSVSRAGTGVAARPPGQCRGLGFHTAMVVTHRYVGLTIATFVLIAGLTGSLLAFYHDLDAVLNPSLMHVSPPTPDAKPLDPFVLSERVQAQLPQVPLNEVILSVQPGHAVSIWVEPVEGATTPADDEYFVDPYTGTVLGSRRWGAISQGTTNLMPFIYELHYSLALGTVGSWLFGIAALLWTIDCFIGFYLTFPGKRVAKVTAGVTGAAGVAVGDQRSWLSRWKPSWLIKGGSLFGTIFTFHRASGLWVWPLLFVFAWSSVGFNLSPVFSPVMNTLFTTSENPWNSADERKPPYAEPRVAMREALSIGRTLMAQEQAARGFTDVREARLQYLPSLGLYRYSVHSSFDLSTLWGGTNVWFNGDTGALHQFTAPTGVNTGDTVSSWLFALHMGSVWGLPYRIVVCVMGVIIAILGVTGVIIWWHKRALRIKAAERARGINSALSSPAGVDRT